MSQRSSRQIVVLTGGPGGGKSALLQRVSRDLRLRSIAIVLEEALYAMRGCGLSPRSAEFQRLLVQRQMEREEHALCIAASEGRPLVLTHRGSLDPCAFWQSSGTRRSLSLR